MMRDDPRSPCVFGAQQHVCKRLSLLPKYITTDRDRVRPRSGPTEGQRQYGNGLFYSNATFETLFSLFGGQFTDEVTFIKLFFPIMSWFIRLLIGRELSFATA